MEGGEIAPWRAILLASLRGVFVAGVEITDGPARGGRWGNGRIVPGAFPPIDG